MNRQLLRRVRQVWVTLGVGVTIVFVGWSLIAYRPSGVARRAATSDDTVAVTRGGGVWSFRSGASSATQGHALVFFPGALVDPVAYAPLLRAVARAGFPAYMIELPRRGAFGGADDEEVSARLDRLLMQPVGPQRWVVGGHSRGAVVASRIASERRHGMSGVVLIGTSHPRDVDLSALRIPITKISGTRDGLASREKVEANRALLPAHTRWVWIEGGNHSRFGWYGFQPGDRRAAVPAEMQRAMMIASVIELVDAASRQ
jgi:pimeloyl-ACP methyl ester carboxylesterase